MWEAYLTHSGSGGGNIRKGLQLDAILDKRGWPVKGERKVLQEEEQHVQRQNVRGMHSFGQDGAECKHEGIPEHEAEKVGNHPKDSESCCRVSYHQVLDRCENKHRQQSGGSLGKLTLETGRSVRRLMRALSTHSE